VPETVKAGLEIIPVSTMDQVLSHALTRQPTPIEWDEAKAPPVAPVEDADVDMGVITH